MEIFTLSDIAEAWGVSRQRAQQLLDAGRVPGYIEGSKNKRYWTEIPPKPKELKRGRPSRMPKE